jgi:hypothetical protein
MPRAVNIAVSLLDLQINLISVSPSEPLSPSRTLRDIRNLIFLHCRDLLPILGIVEVAIIRRISEIMFG